MEMQPPGIALEDLSIKELKRLIEAAGLRCDDCIEKKDLHVRAARAVKLLQTTHVAGDGGADGGGVLPSHSDEFLQADNGRPPEPVAPSCCTGCMISAMLIGFVCARRCSPARVQGACAWRGRSA